jgi:hypothetical protein
MDAKTFIEQVAKFVEDARVAVSGSPTSLTDVAVAYRDRMVMLRSLINDNIDLLPEGFEPIAEFEELPA